MYGSKNFKYIVLILNKNSNYQIDNLISNLVAIFTFKYFKLTCI